MTINDLLKDVMKTKLSLEDIFEAYKMEQNPIERQKLRQYYCSQVLNYLNAKEVYQRKIYKFYTPRTN